MTYDQVYVKYARRTNFKGIINGKYNLKSQISKGMTPVLMILNLQCMHYIEIHDIRG